MKMHKKLLAMAIGATIALPITAVAAGPTLYGMIDLSLENQDDGTADMWVVENNQSRIGVKGEVDTSIKGLKGIYLAEFGIGPDDGVAGTLTDSAGDVVDSVFSQRNSHVGLQGKFGAVKLGHMDSPLKRAEGTVDQFNDSSADMGFYVAGQQRLSNSVVYSSPVLADVLKVNVALVQLEGAASADGSPGDGIGDAVSASVVYDKDGLYLALAMDQETPNTEGGVDLFVSGDAYNDIMRAVATYSTDEFEVGFLYQTAEGADTPASGAEDTSMVLSGAYKTGEWKFKGQYGQTEGDGSANTVTVLAVGADYELGKSTTLSALYATAEDDFAFEQTVLGFGIQQKF